MIYIVLLLGLILRLISLNQSLWLDEATTALVSQMSVSDIFSKFVPGDFHPPLYYLIIHYWSLVFGTSEVALRIPSVTFGVLTVYVVYLIAKVSKFKWPVLPALFLATSGLHIYYSQEARMYSLITLLVTYLVYLYLTKKRILFSIVLVLLFLTDYLPILILPVLLIYSVIYRINVKQLLFSSIPLVITFFAWLPIFIRQLTGGIMVKEGSMEWWNALGTVNFKNLALIPTKFIIGRISIDDKIVYGCLISLLSLLFGYILLKSKNKLIWSWLIISLVLGVGISFVIPTLTYFRYLFLLPPFYLLLSEKITQKFAVLVLVVNLFTTGYYLFDFKFHRENWREVAKVISTDKVVFPNSSQREALTYYGKSENIITKSEVTGKDETIWLSRYVWDIFDPQDTTRKYIESLGYNKVQETNFNGVVLFKYAHSN